MIKYANGIMICAGKYEGTSSPLTDYFGQFKRTSENMKVIFPDWKVEIKGKEGENERKKSVSHYVVYRVSNAHI